MYRVEPSTAAVTAMSCPGGAGRGRQVLPWSSLRCSPASEMATKIGASSSRTYCHACQEEEPDLRRAFAAHRDDGLVVLAIDAGEAPQDVRRYVEERRLPWRIGLDPRLSAYDAYGAIGTPTHYFIGRDGRIAARAFGRLEPDEMEAHLAQILAAAD